MNPNSTICRHCHVRIVLEPYNSGTRWVHHNGVESYWHCRSSVATPVGPGTVAGPDGNPFPGTGTPAVVIG